jgi:hypothetical protein
MLPDFAMIWKKSDRGICEKLSQFCRENLAKLRYPERYGQPESQKIRELIVRKRATFCRWLRPFPFE